MPSSWQELSAIVSTYSQKGVRHDRSKTLIPQFYLQRCETSRSRSENDGGRGEEPLQPSISRISNGRNYRTRGVRRADALQLRESYRDEGVAAKPAGIRSAKTNRSRTTVSPSKTGIS